MNGQWIGTYTGSTGGTIIVNIDEREENYQGVAFLLEKDRTIPSPVAAFRTPDKAVKSQFRTDAIQAIDGVGNIVPWETVRNNFAADITFSKYADVQVCCDHDCLSLSWITDTGTAGN